jgi:hypothetical protein
MTSTELIQSGGSDVTTYREAPAERIKQLMLTWTHNTLALAAELTKAASTFPVDARGRLLGFQAWAHGATGLSKTQIHMLLQVHKKFGVRSVEPRLAQHVMIMLSHKNVPESARQEALKRAEAGEHVGAGTAKKIIKVHKHPPPKTANQQAKEEGRPVLASDGYIYFGTDPGRAKEGEDRRTMVYGVRKALEVLGNIHLTGRQFLNYALPHQLWSEEEAKIIKQALRWVTDLDQAWASRE